MSQCEDRGKTSMQCELLTRGHLAGVPTTRTLWAHIAAALDVASIDESPQHIVSQLLEASVQHPLATAAPRDPTHAREVLQWLREQFQARGWNLPPEFTNNAMPRPEELLEVFYKTYVGWGGSAVGRPGVTLLESGGGIAHNTTGLTTWYGAAILADWAVENASVLAGRRVLELGAGVGFTASVILTTAVEGHPPPASYMITDCHHHVLTLLHHNLTVNLASSPPKREELERFQRHTSEELVRGEVEPGEVVTWPAAGAAPVVVEGGRLATEVSVMQVDWRCPPPLQPVDVVVAADVVYARHLIPALVALIRSILDGSASRQREGDQESQRAQNNRKSGNDTGGRQKSDETSTREGIGEGGEEREREAFIACTRRNQETLSVFLEEVNRQGLAHALVYQATLQTDTALFLYNETHLPVKIYRITVPHNEPNCDV